MISCSPSVVETILSSAMNELSVVEHPWHDHDLEIGLCVPTIFNYNESKVNESKVDDYMSRQPEINANTRAILINWLVKAQNKFELTNETLYLTINIVDRFLEAETVPLSDLLCVGMSAMLIASKYEEIEAPDVDDFVEMSNDGYLHREVVVMEKRILGQLKWKLNVPTPYFFLNWFIKAVENPLETITENMMYFYAELGMMNYEIIRFYPSMVAAAAVYAARATLNKSPMWHETLEIQTGCKEMQVMECAKMMVEFHMVVRDDKRRKEIYEKYSSETRDAVALYPPAKSLLATAITELEN